MVHWGWLIVTAIASSAFSLVMFALFAINRDNP